MPGCNAIYCSNATGRSPVMIPYFQFPNAKTERKQIEIWLNNISTANNINTYKIMLSVVIISMKFVFKSTCKQNCLGMSRSEELYSLKLFHLY